MQAGPSALAGVGAEVKLERRARRPGVQVTPEDPSDEVFVGIAPAADVDRYLGGVGHDVIARSVSSPTR